MTCYEAARAQTRHPKRRDLSFDLRFQIYFRFHELNQVFFTRT